tara:strand:+ start:6818 stop:7459 length:642 start_codon:yes stop_codon:yes gene_type:complete
MDSMLIIDDHPLFAEAVKYGAAQSWPDCRVEISVSFGDAQSRLCEGEKFDLILLDLMLPDAHGPSGLAILREALPGARIVLMSGREEDGVVRSARSYGADGFIGKSTTMLEFSEKLRRIIWGEKLFPALTSKAGDPSELDHRVADLSPAQLRILMAVADGRLNKQIAYDLNLAEPTVKSHLSTIFKKLGVSNRTQAVLVARELLPKEQARSAI